MRSILEEIQWAELEGLVEAASQQQERLSEYRRKRLPWYLHPGAWQARARRDNTVRRVKELTQRMLENSRTMV